MAKVTGESLTPEHVKAARALLGWNANELSRHCDGIGVATVRNFESGKHIREGSRQAICDCIDAAGVELLNGGRIGARMKGGNNAG